MVRPRPRSGPTDAGRIRHAVEHTEETVLTSVRVPAGLQETARECVKLGLAESVSELIIRGLRLQLAVTTAGAAADRELDDVRSALDERYARAPEARPSLAEVVEAAAVVERHPAADHPDLVQAAIDDLGEDAFVEDVFAWVQGALATRKRMRPTRRGR